MPATCVVGLQWGDEAKGKIVDLLSDSHDYVVRYNGGANAGHTIVWGERTFKLSILPTGILKPNVMSVIGNGLVVYPPRMIEELQQLSDGGIEVKGNLRLSDQAHVILPWHLAEEKLTEANTLGAIGTTGRGIGPCYQDKIGRRYSIRVCDLIDPLRLRNRLQFILPAKNRVLASLAENAPQFTIDELIDEYTGYADRLKPFVCDTVTLLNDAISQGKKLLFEAAQGSLLDIDHGTYPFVTSSSSLPGGIWTGSGVSPRKIERIIGIAKAYTTRVGNGPFPSELTNEIGERIRTIGKEFGTVTGRPRRVGWFDAMATKYMATVADVDEISLMLLDVLSGLDEVKICTKYEGNRAFRSDALMLEQSKPVLETLPGWSEDLTKCRKRSDLPANAIRYIERIAEVIGKPITMVSVGPDRDQTIFMDG